MNCPGRRRPRRRTTGMWIVHLPLWMTRARLASVPNRDNGADTGQFRLVPIRHVDIYRAVLAQIESFITENNLQPGDRLPSDRMLADRLGVSRASVRQAIKVLEGFGRIESQHGSGTYVRAPSYTAAIADLTRGMPFDASLGHQLIPVHTAI